jgi:hypothetical protein
VGLHCESYAEYRPTCIELTAYRHAESGLLGSSKPKKLALNPDARVSISDLGIVGMSKSQVRLPYREKLSSSGWMFLQKALERVASLDWLAI